MTSAVTCVGIATRDEIWFVDEAPQPGHKSRARERLVVGGGVAANAAVAIARLGGSASFVGPTGDDEVGDEIIAGLKAESVIPAFMPRVVGQASPVSTVFVDGTGERTIVNHAGSDLFSTAPLPAAVEFANADAVLCDMRWPQAAAVALAEAANNGLAGVVDCDHDPRQSRDMLATASHVIFSLPTLERFTGSYGPTALLQIGSVTDAWVAATAGAGGVYWKDAEGIHHHPAPAVDVVDTLGAGDTFSGAFTLALAEGKDPAQAVTWASAAAALKCTRPGGRIGIPTRGELEDFGEPT